MNVELDRMELATVLRGLYAYDKKFQQHVARAKKRGFREHELAELVMEQTELDKVIERMENAYNEAKAASER